MIGAPYIGLLKSVFITLLFFAFIYKLTLCWDPFYLDNTGLVTNFQAGLSANDINYFNHSRDFSLASTAIFSLPPISNQVRLKNQLGSYLAGHFFLKKMAMVISIFRNLLNQVEEVQLLEWKLLAMKIIYRYSLNY